MPNHIIIAGPCRKEVAIKLISKISVHLNAEYEKVNPKMDDVIHNANQSCKDNWRLAGYCIQIRRIINEMDFCKCGEEVKET